MTTISNKARAKADEFLAAVAKNNGISDPSRIYNVAPRIEQRLESTVMQSNSFLKRVNNYGVKEIKGDILAMEVPSTITKRTRTPDNNRNGSLRRPTDPTSLSERSYECFEVEQDTKISWDKIDMWANLPNFYQKYRNMVDFAKARDRLLVMWHGQKESPQTDPATHTRLQDVNKGFFQFMIEENPSQVLGWDASANNGAGGVKTFKVDPEDAAADFKTINQLVYMMRYEIMHELFQEQSGLRVLIGNDLTVSENIALLGNAEQDKPSERIAVEKYLPKSVYGETPRIKSDEFPRRGIFLSSPSNLSRYFQIGSTRRKIKEVDHEHKGLVDYNYTREDYVLEAAEGAVCVHPDAILMKDEDGQWAPASKTWAI